MPLNKDIKNIINGVLTVVAILAAAYLFILGFSEYTRADWGIISVLIVILTILLNKTNTK